MRRKSCHILLLLTGWLYIPTAALCKDPIKNAVEISNKLTDTSTLRTLPPVSLFLDKSFLSKKDDNVGFIYHDSVAFGHPVSLTKEKTSIYINAPILIQLGKNQALYLIYPGEQIQMKADENNSFVLSIEGNYQRTNELNFFRQLTKKTGSIFPYNPFFDTISYHKKVESLLQLEAVGKVINNLMTSRLKFLDSFSTAVKVSGGFREIAKNSITVAALQDSLVLYYQNKEMLKQLNVFDSTLYEKKRSVMNIPFYALFYFLRTYDMFRNLSLSNFLQYDPIDSNQFRKKFTYSSTNFEGEIRNFLLARTLFEALTYKIPVADTYIAQFNKQCTDPVYKTLIAEKINEKRSFNYPVGSNKLMHIDNKTINDLKYILARYKGRLVLLDFWASWCAPCRAEMPFSSKLKEQYVKKGVEFLYISTDDKRKDWINANRDEKLDDNNSFLFINFADASFKKDFKINTIPHYILIGKDGRIISANAPRPSDPKLKELIDKNL